MPQLRGQIEAFGGPGAESRWTHANKEGVGTAYDLDRPQMRDARFLFVDGAGRCIDERQGVRHKIERIASSQGFRITSCDTANTFTIVKEIITHPRRASILIHAELLGPEPSDRGEA